MPAVVARLERGKEFCDKLGRKLSSAKAGSKRPVDEKMDLSRLLLEARKKKGLHSAVQLLESVWPDLSPVQIETLRSGSYSPAIKAAAERLASKGPSR